MDLQGIYRLHRLLKDAVQDSLVAANADTKVVDKNSARQTRNNSQIGQQVFLDQVILHRDPADRGLSQTDSDRRQGFQLAVQKDEFNLGKFPLDNLLIRKSFGDGKGSAKKILETVDVLVVIPHHQDRQIFDVRIGEDYVFVPGGGFDDIEHDIKITGAKKPQKLVPGRTGNVVGFDSKLARQQIHVIDGKALSPAVHIEIERLPIHFVVNAQHGMIRQPRPLLSAEQDRPVDKLQALGPGHPSVFDRRKLIKCDGVQAGFDKAEQVRLALANTEKKVVVQKRLGGSGNSTPQPQSAHQRFNCGIFP